MNDTVEDLQKRLYIYREAFSECQRALLAIANYSNSEGQSWEEYARSVGVDLDGLRVSSETDWQFLRRANYEIAEGALARSNQLLSKLE